MILIIEDNEDDSDLLIYELAKADTVYDIRVIADGKAALDYLLAPQNKLPKLIILDLKLPSLPGLSLLRKIRAERRTELIPVIILTSSHDEHDYIASQRFGAHAAVSKPLDINTFNDLLDRHGWQI